jgi:hypothetical protein
MPKTDDQTPIEDENRTFVDDNPQNDWGDAIEDVAFGANHALRGRPAPEDREHGRKTRLANKNEISRRA